MTIIQSAWAKGIKQAVRPQTAGAVHTQKFSITLEATADETDIIELGVLPAYAHIVDAVLFTEGTFTGITADVGIMSGAVGSTDGARTCDEALFADADLTKVTRLAKASAWLLAPKADTHRSIGAILSGEVAGAGTKKLHLVLSYIQ